MDKLSKSREEICKDCMFGIVLDNCSSCLYNVLNKEGKQGNAKSVEKKPQEKTLDKDIASNVAI